MQVAHAGQRCREWHDVRFVASKNPRLNALQAHAARSTLLYIEALLVDTEG